MPGSLRSCSQPAAAVCSAWRPPMPYTVKFIFSTCRKFYYLFQCSRCSCSLTSFAHSAAIPSPPISHVGFFFHSIFFRTHFIFIYFFFIFIYYFKVYTLKCIYINKNKKKINKNKMCAKKI